MLTTNAGDLDLLGEITGGGTYPALLPDSELVLLFDIPCRCLTLRRLITAKRDSGRPRDLDALAELEAIREEGEAGKG
jgi:hypothetical protein